MYFTHNLKTYVPHNKKSLELNTWIARYNNKLIENDFILDNFIELIQKKIDELNQKYHKTKPLRYTEHRFNDISISIQDGVSSNNLCYIEIQQTEIITK